MNFVNSYTTMYEYKIYMSFCTDHSL